MSYINEFEVELRTKLNGPEDEETVIAWVSEKVLESYRNGLKAGKNGTPVIRDGKSRRRDGFPKQAR